MNNDCVVGRISYEFRRVGILMLVWLCFLPDCSSASFDCARSVISAEKIICSNPELSRLNEKMFRGYIPRMADNVDSGYMRIEQRAWIKKRITCLDIHCLILRYDEQIFTQVKEATSQTKAAIRNKEICDRMHEIFVLNIFDQYSVSFVQQTEGELEYNVSFKNIHLNAKLKAYCGNGAGALCELELFSENGKKFAFTLPATIRVLNIDGDIYIVNGIEIDGKKNVVAKDYTVHELHSESIRLICDKF